MNRLNERGEQCTTNAQVVVSSNSTKSTSVFCKSNGSTLEANASGRRWLVWNDVSSDSARFLTGARLGLLSAEEVFHRQLSANVTRFFISRIFVKLLMLWIDYTVASAIQHCVHCNYRIQTKEGGGYKIRAIIVPTEFWRYVLFSYDTMDKDMTGMEGPTSNNCALGEARLAVATIAIRHDSRTTTNNSLVSSASGNLSMVSTTRARELEDLKYHQTSAQ